MRVLLLLVVAGAAAAGPDVTCPASEGGLHARDVESQEVIDVLKSTLQSVREAVRTRRWRQQRSSIIGEHASRMAKLAAEAGSPDSSDERDSTSHSTTMADRTQHKEALQQL